MLQPIHLPNHFQVEANGQTLAIIDRMQYTLPLSGVPLVDEAKMEQLVKRIERQVYQAPVNAIIDEQGRIVSEQPGRQLYRNAFIRDFYSSFYGSDQTVLKVPFQMIYPRVDAELLSHLREKRIGHYATYFNSGNRNRSHNITLAAKAIDNYVVFPGETFSFNKVVGQRTKEKGYREAPVIVRGELAEGIGGGICQVSSTLFNAVDRAGLHIVKRYSHSRHVPYVPPGRGATVSWYGPDFQFQNKYGYPVLIRARSYHGQMVISIHSFEDVEYKPRHVPGATERLPEEIRIGRGNGSG
jgi:vancomycin resistance protein YoaR